MQNHLLWRFISLLWSTLTFFNLDFSPCFCCLNEMNEIDCNVTSSGNVLSQKVLDFSADGIRSLWNVSDNIMEKVLYITRKNKECRPELSCRFTAWCSVRQCWWACASVCTFMLPSEIILRIGMNWMMSNYYDLKVCPLFQKHNICTIFSVFAFALAILVETPVMVSMKNRYE